MNCLTCRNPVPPDGELELWCSPLCYSAYLATARVRYATPPPMTPEQDARLERLLRETPANGIG